jgi:hypothetical protein
MELKEIIKQVKDSCDDNELEVTPDMILDVSVRIFNSQNISNKSPEKKSDESEKATMKQLNYLRRLGYNGSEELTKLEAKKLIEEALNNK